MAQANPTKPVVKDNKLFFIENKGQVIDQFRKSRTDIDFRIGGCGVSLFVGNGQLHYQWSNPIGAVSKEQSQRVAMSRMDVALLGADPHAKVVTENKQDAYERYYSASPNEAIAASFQKITYQNVYPNIDWVFYVKDNVVEYDFVVRPGGHVSDIKIQYDGATALHIDDAGKLTATSVMGSINEHAPMSFQADGQKVASAFVLNDNVLSFSVAPYSGTLTIDPTLSWATYYGGSLNDNTRNGTVVGDKYGNVYFGGYTASTTNIATTGSFQDTLTANTDGFLVKFNSAGVRKWSTYYGGAASDYVYGVACDPLGRVYICGYTNSTSGIASSGAYQTTLGTTGSGQDAFLVKFDTSGARQWATYYGGTATDQGTGVACDAVGNVYLTGYTQSTASIATTGAFQASLGGSQDAFVAKFNSTGTRLWATYFGGTDVDQGLTITCDTFRNVFLAGYTQSSTGIATTGSYQAIIGGGQDGFVAKFDSTGAQQWASYLGGSGTDRANSINCDAANNVYLAGYASSTAGIATTGSYQAAYGGGVVDGFLAKFTNAGAMKWSTYYGGSLADYGWGVSNDVLGNVYLAGQTNSTSGIAVTGTFKDTLDAQDAYLVKFDSTGSRLWGTYFGGTGVEVGYGVYCNYLSKVFLGGQTGSTTGLATLGSHQSTYGGSTYDAFLAEFDDCLMVAPSAITGNDTVCRGATYTYSVPVVAGALSYTWTLPSGYTGTSTGNSISVVVGSNSDTLKVVANFPCGASTVTKKGITVSALPVLSPSGKISLCNGDSVTLTSNLGTAYSWLQAGMVIAGATNQTYVARNSNTYKVVVTSAKGCVDTSAADTVIVHPLPVPVITASGTLLSTGSFVSYQWKHSGVSITGAINPTFTIVISSGNYTVTVTDSNGCTGTSAAYNPSVSVPTVSGKDRAILLYPNPVFDVVHIDMVIPINVAISSVEGRLLANYNQAKDIDVSGLANGIYLLRITDRSGALISVEKLIKSSK